MKAGRYPHLRIFIHDNARAGAYELCFVGKDHDGRQWLLTPEGWKELTPEEGYKEFDDVLAPVRIDTRDIGPLQDLAEQLWRLGIRPTQAVGSEGQVAAMKAHLSDLQRIVFDSALLKNKGVAL